MLDINLNLYKVFYIVAQSKSFSDASNKLNISTTAISKNINQLENLLNVKLFTRESNGVKLTTAGNELFLHIDKSMTAIDLGEKLVLQNNDLYTGEIIIGCPSHISTFYLIKYLEKFKKDFPDVTIKLKSGANANELLELLENHKIDFIIDSTQIEPRYNNIVIKEIKEIPNIFISKEPINITELKDLENFKYILPFEYTSTTKKLIDCLKKNKIIIKPNIEIDITELRISAVKRDLGIAYVMEDSVQDEIEDKKLYKVKIPLDLPKSIIKLIYIDGQLTNIDKKFIKKYLRK